MIILKDDKVKLACGATGVVTDLFGKARLHMWFKNDLDGKSEPMPASDVVEIVQRGPIKWGRRKDNEN
ncbi:hypothetical protein [Paenibacillus sinopodophylli]|uniref:hypothetical protein n=1 Tax=Paenibacillus sinopodophylli TaxID=1837342 RepID=UPI00110D23B3|nr:hypothetical protein [Paenibacillus sinopodophylli]